MPTTLHAADRGFPLFTLYGVVVNGLWLYVVKSRGSRPARSGEGLPSERGEST